MQTFDGNTMQQFYPILFFFHLPPPPFSQSQSLPPFFFFQAPPFILLSPPLPSSSSQSLNIFVVIIKSLEVEQMVRRKNYTSEYGSYSCCNKKHK